MVEYTYEPLFCRKIKQRGGFFVLLEDALAEYDYHCLARNYTSKTVKDKRQELKQIKDLLNERHSIKVLTSMTRHDVNAY